MTHPCQKNSIHSALRAAYSLLEVLLALALSVAIFAAIASAIQVYMVSLTRHQANIEREQVVRGLLTMIGNDLRAGVQYKANDYSGLENLLASQSLSGTQSAIEDFLGNSADIEGDLPTEDSTQQMPDNSESAEPLYDESEVAFRPAMLGSQSALMIDISRLPRMDQYNPLLVDQFNQNQSPSDVKSIAYFVSSAGLPSSDQQESGLNNGAVGGLYRREVDRAVESYAGANAIVEEPDQSTRLVATEISRIEFRYFDGSEWQTEWDSEEQGGFPPAIEVTLTVDPGRLTNSSQVNAQRSFDEESMQTYRTVVHLPVAEVVADE